MRSCAQIAALACVALAALAPSSVALVPVLNKVTPNRGYSIGGFRVTIEGRNLAFLPDQIDVGVGKQACEDVRIEQPWKSLSCRMPECKGCTSQAIRVNIAGILSNAVDFTYTGVCEGEQLLENRPTLKLPAQYYRAENCTICRSLVSSTIASTPDRVSYESLRLAMRDSCGSPSVRSYRVMDPICKKNIRDYFVPVRSRARCLPCRRNSWAREWVCLPSVLPAAVCLSLRPCLFVRVTSCVCARILLLGCSALLSCLPSKISCWMPSGANGSHCTISAAL
jgi:hypothetical protein